MNRRNERGFSFIEIMVVVIILGVLAAIVLPRFAGRTEQARISAAQTQLEVLATALDGYELDSGRYPTTEQGLAALVEAPSSSPVPTRWNGPYLRRAIPQDPWDVDYQYRSPGLQNEHSYDLQSFGPDGQSGGGDDISNW